MIYALETNRQITSSASTNKMTEDNRIETLCAFP